MMGWEFGATCQTGHVGRSDTSLNQQFKQQYLDVVDTIQQHALWRIGERLTHLEQFHCHCQKCGYESTHQRFDIARHQLLFGRSIRQVEDPRPMIRCQRCGVQRHTRDLDELVAPTTIRLRALVLDEIPAPGRRTTPLGEGLSNAIAAFRQEASPPVCRGLLVDVAGEAEPEDTAFVEALGHALLVHRSHIADVVATLG